jgi:hypothetical protein
MSKIEIPEEVKKLNFMVQKLAAFKTVVAEGSFPGKKSKVVDDLLMHLHEEYTQVFEQFNNHPAVKAAMEAQAKQDAEDEKLAKELEQELTSKMEIK